MNDPEPAPAEPAARAVRVVAGRWRNDLMFFAIAAMIVAADQFTKWLVRSNLALGEQWPDQAIFNFRIIHLVNSGAAFGILQGQTSFLIGTSLFGLAAIVVYYVFPPMEHGLIRVALGMQLGGAIGNLVDRVRLGEVTDFIGFGHFPTFNVADSSISVSIVVVLIFFALQEAEDARKRRQPSDAGSPARQDD